MISTNSKTNEHESSETCTNCDGTGVMADFGNIDLGIEESEVPCNYCRGTGKIIYHNLAEIKQGI